MINRLLLIFKGIYRGKFRNILTIISISIGVMSVVLIGNISSSATSIINDKLGTLGTNSLLISTSSKNYEQYFTPNELNTINDDPTINRAMPIMVEPANVTIAGVTDDMYLWGTAPIDEQVIDMNIIYGRNINNSDITSSNLVCLVDQDYAEKHYKRDNIIGKKITVECSQSTEELTVVGIIQSNSNMVQNIATNYVSDLVYIPYTTAMQMTGVDSFEQIAIDVKNEYNSQNISESIISNLKHQNIDNYHITNMSQEKTQFFQVLDIITLVLAIIAGISLLVASLSIMTVMLVSVKDRKQEIGIKKSIGASRENIFFEFLVEALLISLIGCIIGVALGIIFPLIVSYIINISFVINFKMISLSIIFAILSSVIFGVYPAMKASKLNPVDALRRE